MKKNHNLYTNLAFNLAESNLGKTKFNPSVGCIVVKNNSVISSGITSINGRPHAEQNALKKNINFKGSDMYLTLEPCAHYGKTPPCINLIKRKKIKKVYYIYNDPDLRTHKKAKKILKKKILKLNKAENNSDFYYSYFLNKKKNIPLIDAKIAVSKDFYTINRKSKWITNLRSRKVAHLIRSKYDCIISTSKSINKDNSILNCRIDGLNNFKPDLVIIDRNLILKKKLKLFDISKKRRTYIITTIKNPKKLAFFIKKKIKIIHISSLKNKNDFKLLLKKLFQAGKRRLLIETGLIFLKKIVNYELLDNLYIFKSGNELDKNGLNNTEFKYFTKLSKNNELRVNLGNDKLYKVKIK